MTDACYLPTRVSSDEHNWVSKCKYYRNIISFFLLLRINLINKKSRLEMVQYLKNTVRIFSASVGLPT